MLPKIFMEKLALIQKSSTSAHMAYVELRSILCTFNENARKYRICGVFLPPKAYEKNS